MKILSFFALKFCPKEISEITQISKADFYLIFDTPLAHGVGDNLRVQRTHWSRHLLYLHNVSYIKVVSCLYFIKIRFCWVFCRQDTIKISFCFAHLTWWFVGVNTTKTIPVNPFTDCDHTPIKSPLHVPTNADHRSINALHTLRRLKSADDSVKFRQKFAKNVKLVGFWYYIWNQRENYIQMSTNMPGIGSVICEINLKIKSILRKTKAFYCKTNSGMWSVRKWANDKLKMLPKN